MSSDNSHCDNDQLLQSMISLISEDERYERRGDDMIHHVYFDRQYIGMTSEIQLTKINGQSNTFVASLYEGHLLQLPFHGFVRADGGSGNYYFIIHFSQ